MRPRKAAELKRAVTYGPVILLNAYSTRCDALLPENTHLVAIVIFQTQLDAQGQYVPNNFVVTGWATYIWSQR